MLELQEPATPSLVTAVPGPKSKKLLSELSEVQSMASIQFFVDYKASRGNYIVDADGNKVYVKFLIWINQVPTLTTYF